MALAARTPPTAAEFVEYRQRFCNWGRWGDDDELGTLNHITPDLRRRAAGLVEEGVVVPLARTFDTLAGPSNPYPAQHLRVMPGAGGFADYIGMFIHGVTNTHIDALCHITTLDGLAWQGKPAGQGGVPSEHSGTIDFLRAGVVTRGILYDIPTHRGTDFVKEGEPVHGWELEDFAAARNITPEPGDAVLIRSGYEPYWLAADKPKEFASFAGVHASCIEFLYETDASLLLWDMMDAPTSDQGIPNPSPNPDFPIALHVHHIVLPYMGMPMVDSVDLEELSATCSKYNRWEFQLVVAPLDIPMGTGSPVNPLAIL
jgi:kynurenine formamidase